MEQSPPRRGAIVAAQKVVGDVPQKEMVERRLRRRSVRLATPQDCSRLRRSFPRYASRYAMITHAPRAARILVAALLLSLLPGTSRAGGTYSVDGVNVLSAPSWMNGALGGAKLEITKHPLETPVSMETASRITAALGALASNPKACSLTELRIRAPVPPGALSLLGAPCLTGIQRLTVMIEGPDFDIIATELLDLPLAASLRELELVSLLALPPGPLTTLAARLPSLEMLRVDVRAPVELAPYAAALAMPQPDALAHVTLVSYPATPLSPSIWGPLVQLPRLQAVSFHQSVLDLPAAAALLESGLGARLPVLAVGRVDRDAAIRIGKEAPAMRLDFGCSGNCDELRAAWSSARAGGAMKDGVVDGEVRLFHDDDARRLAGVTVIKGRLSIQGPIEDLSPLRELTAIEGDLSLYGTTLLRDVEGLGGLRRVSGSVQITRNLRLRSTAGFASLREVGTWISIPTCKGGNPRLAEIAFPALESVGESVLVSPKPGRLGDDDWRSDDPDCGRTYVNWVRVAPFRRLVHVGGHSQRGRGLPDAEPTLFPVLESPPTTPSPAEAP